MKFYDKDLYEIYFLDGRNYLLIYVNFFYSILRSKILAIFIIVYPLKIFDNGAFLNYQGLIFLHFNKILFGFDYLFQLNLLDFCILTTKKDQISQNSYLQNYENPLNFFSSILSNMQLQLNYAYLFKYIVQLNFYQIHVN